MSLINGVSVATVEAESVRYNSAPLEGPSRAIIDVHPVSGVGSTLTL
ncbi:hypothetical protein [Sulfodiicoccus acidiphilus]|nr:hypothetical protein [Sulfodiicoccus acidiphilus]